MTLKVRIDVDNPRYDLRPDMFVDVEIPITMPPSVSVPVDAVLETGKKAIVYVDKGNGIFEPRRVKTGWNLGGQVEITDGLMAGEKIVISGNFLIDSESRMEITASGAEVKMNDDPVPGGHVRGTQVDGNRGDRAIMPGTDRSWVDMLDPVKSRRGVRSGSEESEQNIRDSLGKPATSPGVIDWDGPDKEGAPARDWRDGANSQEPITSASSARPRTVRHINRTHPKPKARSRPEKKRVTLMSPLLPTPAAPR
jgi:hypothetical protein